MTRAFIPKLALALLVGSATGLRLPIPSPQLAVLFALLLTLTLFAHVRKLWTNAFWLFAVIAMACLGALLSRQTAELEEARWASLYGPVEHLTVRVISDPYLEKRAVLELLDPPHAGLRMRLTFDAAAIPVYFGETLRIFGTAHGRTIVMRETERAPGWVPAMNPVEQIQFYCFKFRDYLDRAIQSARPPPAFLAFARAELFGKRADLDARTLRVLQENGLTHIIAVSGMHTSLLAAILFYILAPSFGRDAAVWVTLVAVAAFAVVVGLQPAVVRAAFCTALTLIGVHLGRSVNLVTILSSAFIQELVIFPEHLTNAGFQLSYLSVLAMALSAEASGFGRGGDSSEMERRSVNLDKPLLAVLTLLMIQIFTAPLSAHYFFRWSWLSLVSNLLFLPIFTFLISLAAGGAAIALVLPACASWLFWLGDYVLGASISFLESLPHWLSVSSNFGELPFWLLMSLMTVWGLFLAVAPKKIIWWTSGACVFLLLFSLIPWARNLAGPLCITAGGDQAPYAAIGQGSRITFAYVSAASHGSERALRSVSDRFLREGLRHIDSLAADPASRAILAREFHVADRTPDAARVHSLNHGFHFSHGSLDLIYWNTEGATPPLFKDAQNQWLILEANNSAINAPALSCIQPQRIYITGSLDPSALRKLMTHLEAAGAGEVLAYQVDGRIDICYDKRSGWQYATDLMRTEE